MYRIMCEWCGDIIIGKRKRFCCRLCQNRYFANNKSEETRKKLSDAKKGCNNPFYGKHHTDETRKKISDDKKGRNHPMYGKHHTDATKKKMSDAKKGCNNPLYGKHLSDDHKKKLSDSNKGHKLSDDHKKKISDATAKNYRDGSKTHIIEEYQIIANEIYEYKCCGCGKTEGKLMVHHIDGDHDNNSPDNLVWLCFGCHNKAHPNRPKGDSSVDEEFTELIIENRELNRR